MVWQFQVFFVFPIIYKREYTQTEIIKSLLFEGLSSALLNTIMENINNFLLISLIALMNYSALSSPIYQGVCSNVSLEVNKGVAVSREVLVSKSYLIVMILLSV